MSNRDYVNGDAAVSGDDLNTFVQNIGSVVLLRNFVGRALDNTTPMIVYLQGLVTTGDGGQGYFWWNTNNASDDDGNDVIVPNGAGAGAWNRLLELNPATITVSHLTANHSVAAGESGTHFDNFGATATVVAGLPAAAEGLQYCFAVLANQTLQINAVGANVIWMGSTATVAAGHISSNLPASSICLEAHDASQWLATSFTGTWNMDA